MGEPARQSLARELRDAIGRTGPQVPAEVKQQLEAQLVTTLQRMEPGKPLVDQGDRAPRVVELMGHLFGTVRSTGSAPEEFWQDVVMPLLHIGNPSQFPPLDEEEVKAAQSGIDPLFSLPGHRAVPDARARRGAAPPTFSLEDLQLPDPRLQNVHGLRLIELKRARLRADDREVLIPQALKATRSARFATYVEQKAGKPVPSTAEGQQLLDGVHHPAHPGLESASCGCTVRGLCLRRVTEAGSLLRARAQRHPRGAQWPADHLDPVTSDPLRELPLDGRRSRCLPSRGRPADQPSLPPREGRRPLGVAEQELGHCMNVATKELANDNSCAPTRPSITRFRHLTIDWGPRVTLAPTPYGSSLRASAWNGRSADQAWLGNAAVGRARVGSRLEVLPGPAG